MVKIYTKTGDKGKTSLVDGTRVSKAHLRIELVGTLDEANAHIGFILSTIPENNPNRELLTTTQSLLFMCGSRVAEPGKSSLLNLSLPDKGIIGQYEKSIDTMTRQLPPLNQFILPGGTELAAKTHLARAVIRRSERIIVALKDNNEHIDPEILQLVNRLSDWLFTLARFFNHEAGRSEIIWSP